ncbi:unnamed protein product [Acanthoscelides obtectus]|uniref:Secreted protein n=1 Tax=Acanthoscelides obtectus TaxID=200917 RepID=A0A9P0JU89_ACAOB|nr:unnamed protein product [Acanthoscelides obtectus]CAK1641360.1 hypothetical protein AOBTE_LOCUS12358 [Acanthoscelides obtectus]
MRWYYYIATVLLTMTLGAAGGGGGKGHRRQYSAVGSTSAMVHQLHRARLMSAQQQEKENEFLNKGKSKCPGRVIL